MQHYGAPTRLLDWSHSPYVAAYHATGESRGQDGELDGAVFLVNRFYFEGRFLQSIQEQFAREHKEIKSVYDVEKIFEYLLNGALDQTELPCEVTFWEPRMKTARMVAQQGLFSVSPNPYARHDEVIVGTVNSWKGRPLGEVFCDKWIIPADQKVEFRRHLRSMNITASTLFPGIDGFGKSIEDVVRLRIEDDRGDVHRPIGRPETKV